MSKVMMKGQAQGLNPSLPRSAEFELKEATRLSDEGELDKAWEIVDKHLHNDPSEPLALLIASHIMERAKKTPVAYSLAKRVTELRPERPEGWINVGRCADELWRIDEAIECYKKALSMSDIAKQKLLILTNLAGALIQDGRFSEAEPVCRQALMIDSADFKSRHNLGICLLARREWEEGWKNYSSSIGTDSRRLVRYGDEPTWDGSKDKTVVIYGEQGLGDEISFASMVPDANRDCAKVILDCDRRLVGLFKRSFPRCKVYGTRSDQALDWAAEDRTIDASISSGEIGKFYRNTPESFPGTPYLKADPERTLMWKALFAHKKKPTIGIAWTGGTWKTGSPNRQLSEEALKSLIGFPAHWVSLQYKPCAHPEGVSLYHYATLTPDYDDTAALVAACDMVVTMQTTVAHTAAALGVPTWVMVPKRSQWRYGTGYTDVPWYKAMKVYRNESDWGSTVQKIKSDLAARFTK